MKQSGGLKYGIETSDDAHAANIDFLGSEDPIDRATARLNQALINTLDSWMDEEALKGSSAAEVVIAAMHGITTICGTILVNSPEEKRPEIASKIRAHMIKIYDDMVDAVGKED